MTPALYLDTSAVLRAVLESGTSPEIERQIQTAPALITSRLSIVESARAFHRLRTQDSVRPAAVADAELETARLWSRCEIWELTPEVCEFAGAVAPGAGLRTLDALHLATFLLARRALGAIDLVTADDRLLRAVETSSSGAREG